MKKPSPSETTRLTISLPTALVRELDARLVQGDASRTTAIRRLIEAALREIEAREEREQYVRAWKEQPETEEEIGWMTSPAALEHLDEIPWESDAAPSGGRTSRSRGDAGPSS